MTIALWGAITGTLSLALVAARELLTYLPIIRVEGLNGYELSRIGADQDGAPELVRASFIIRVRNWSARPITIAGRALALEDGRVVRFAPSMPAGFETVAPWAPATFAVPLVELAAVPDIDAARGVVVPVIATSDRRILRGRPVPLVSDAEGLPKERVLERLRTLAGERRPNEPSRISERLFMISEAAPMSQDNAEAEDLVKRVLTGGSGDTS